MKKIPGIIYKFLPTFRLPRSFWVAEKERGNCVYFESCTENEFLFVNKSFTAILGYPVEMIGEGYSTKQIADKLHISINTVETHRRHLLEKIQVKNSMELIKQTSNAF